MKQRHLLFSGVLVLMLLPKVLLAQVNKLVASADLSKVSKIEYNADSLAATSTASPRKISYKDLGLSVENVTQDYVSFTPSQWNNIPAGGVKIRNANRSETAQIRVETRGPDGELTHIFKAPVNVNPSVLEYKSTDGQKITSLRFTPNIEYYATVTPIADDSIGRALAYNLLSDKNVKKTDIPKAVQDGVISTKVTEYGFTADGLGYVELLSDKNVRYTLVLNQLILRSNLVNSGLHDFAMTPFEQATMVVNEQLSPQIKPLIFQIVNLTLFSPPESVPALQSMLPQ